MDDVRLPGESKAQATRRKELEVLQERMKGRDFDTIAKQVGYSTRGAACRAYHRAIKRTAKDEAGDLTPREQRDAERIVALARLHEMRAAVWPRAARGDLKAVNTILRIDARCDALLGLTKTAALEDAHHQPADESGENVVPSSRLEQMRAKLAQTRSGTDG